MGKKQTLLPFPKSKVWEKEAHKPDFCLMAAPTSQKSAVRKPSEESLWVFSVNINSNALNDWSSVPPWAIKAA